MKIFLAMPTLGNIDTRMASFLYDLIGRSPHTILIQHTNRMPVQLARNKLMKDFLKTDCDHLLFLDDDNIPEDVNFIDTLLSVDLPIVSGLIPSRVPDEEGIHRLCIFGEEIHDCGKHEYVQFLNIPPGPDCFEIANCGMGCVLIRRDIIGKMNELYTSMCEMRDVWYYSKDGKWVRDDVIDYASIKDGDLRFKRYMSEDLLFFDRVRDLGMPIFAHKKVFCTHIGQNNIISIKKHVIGENYNFPLTLGSQ